MSDSYIIGKVEEYFYFEDDLCETIESWAQKHCDTFSSTHSENYEQPLEHMQLFQEYTRLFESLMESFLQTEGITLMEFYNAVRNEYETAQLSRKESSTFTSILLASLEFENFCEMMHNVKEGNGVVFCPPLVDDESFAAQKIDVAMPKDEYKYGMNEYAWKGSSSQAKAPVQHVLLEAVHRANVEQVRHLLSIDQEVLSSMPPVIVDKVDDAHGRTPLLVCGLAPGNRDRIELGKDCVKIAKMLHKSGADMKHVDSAGWDAIAMGAVRGMTPFCRYLIKFHDLDVNHRDDSGRTALMKAAAHGYFDTFVMLYRRGARLEQETDDIGMTAMHYGTTFALQNPTQMEFFKNLTRFVSKDTQQPQSTKQQSVLPIHIDTFVDTSGRTCLMYAVISNNIEVSKALLSVGADPRKTDNFGVSCHTMTSDDTLRELLTDASIALVEKEHSEWLKSSTKTGGNAQEVAADDGDSHDEEF